MQTACRSRYRAFVFSEYGLESFQVLSFYVSFDELGQRSFAKSVKLTLEFIMRTVVEKT